MKTTTGLPLFPWTVEKSVMFEAEVHSAADSHGTITIIFQGDHKTAEFIAVAANRMPQSMKGENT